MKCDELRVELSAYIDGELSELERLKVEHHVQRCAACASEYDALRLTVEFLRAHLEPETEVPPGFREGLRARLAQLAPLAAVSAGARGPGRLARPSGQQSGQARRSRRFGLPAAVAAAAAAAALAFAYSPAGPFADPNPVSVARADREASPASPHPSPREPGTGTRVSDGSSGRPAPGGAPEAQPNSPDSSSGSGRRVEGRGLPGQGNQSGRGAAAGQGEPQGGAPSGEGAPRSGPDFPSSGGYVEGLGTETASPAGKPAHARQGEVVAVTYTEHVAVRDVDEALRKIKEIVERFGGTILNPPRVVGTQRVEVVFQVPAGREQEASAQVRALGRVVGSELPLIEDNSDKYNQAQDSIDQLKKDIQRLEANVRQGVLSASDAEVLRAKAEQRLRDEEANVNYYWERSRVVDFVVQLEKDETPPQPTPSAGS